jgi:hypothetical protein
MNDATRFVAMSAEALIDAHGIDAARIAADKAAAKLSHGDAEGARVWIAVRDEIERRQALDARPEGTSGGAKLRR